MLCILGNLKGRGSFYLNFVGVFQILYNLFLSICTRVIEGWIFSNFCWLQLMLFHSLSLTACTKDLAGCMCFFMRHICLILLSVIDLFTASLQLVLVPRHMYHRYNQMHVFFTGHISNLFSGCSWFILQPVPIHMHYTDNILHVFFYRGKCAFEEEEKKSTLADLKKMAAMHTWGRWEEGRKVCISSLRKMVAMCPWGGIKGCIISPEQTNVCYAHLRKEEEKEALAEHKKILCIP